MFTAFIVAAAVAQASPQAAMESLLATDRGFSAVAAERDPVEGLAAMFSPDVAMAVGRARPEGREALLAALRASPNFRGAHFSWRPIGGAVSADGTHGFTLGYAELAGASAPERAGRRYLAYWVKRPEGWRVIAYRQVIRQAGEQASASYVTALPSSTVRPRPASGEALASQVSAAERAFSDRAQQIGLKEAFREFGRPDSVHVASQSGFRIGLSAVVDGFEAGTTSPLRWSTDRALVASSGDLGVSIGRIYPNAAPPEGQPGEIPFFTVWRRDPGGQWRYIAE